MLSDLEHKHVIEKQDWQEQRTFYEQALEQRFEQMEQFEAECDKL